MAKCLRCQLRVHELSTKLYRKLDHPLVLREVAIAERRLTRLPGPQEFTGASQREVTA
jgi:hypothetical protein